MNAVNNVLNRIDAWSDAGAIKKYAGRPLATLAVAVPAELTAIGQNVLKAPFQAAGLSVKTLIVRPLAYITGSESLKNLSDKLPGVKDLLNTISKIVRYTIGTFLTATLGVILPKANFSAHCALGLISNNRQEAAAKTEETRKAALEAIEAKRQEKLYPDLTSIVVETDNQPASVTIVEENEVETVEEEEDVTADVVIAEEEAQEEIDDEILQDIARLFPEEDLEKLIADIAELERKAAAGKLTSVNDESKLAKLGNKITALKDSALAYKTQILTGTIAAGIFAGLLNQYGMPDFSMNMPNVTLADISNPFSGLMSGFFGNGTITP